MLQTISLYLLCAAPIWSMVEEKIKVGSVDSPSGRTTIYEVKINRKEKTQVIVINRTDEKLIFKWRNGEAEFLPEKKRPTNCHQTDKILSMLPKETNITLYSCNEINNKIIKIGTLRADFFYTPGNYTIIASSLKSNPHDKDEL